MKINDNGTALIRTKTKKLDHLVNTNLLVNFNKPSDTRENKKLKIKSRIQKSQSLKIKLESTIREKHQMTLP